MKSVLKELVTVLHFDDKLNNKLNENNIQTVEDLWKLTKKELKQRNFNDQDIHQIMIRLELHGLDIGKKVVKL